MARLHVLFGKQGGEIAEPDIAALWQELLPLLDFEYGALLCRKLTGGSNPACTEWGRR